MSKSPLNIVVVGAHPDDCEVKVSGTAALWAKQGHNITFLSVTNGQSGHHLQAGPVIVERRRKEAQAAADVIGINSMVMPIPDGFLEPTLENRFRLLRIFRELNTDVIITHRPNDYHPDHRYTSQLVQDCAYLITVPNLAPEVPSLRKNPVIYYMMDNFQKPLLFNPDVVVDIDTTWETKIQMLHQHESQLYEWIAWHEGVDQQVPPAEDEAGRIEWLKGFAARWDNPPKSELYREQLIARYGQNRGSKVAHCEAYELCEYGSQPDEAFTERLFGEI